MQFVCPVCGKIISRELTVIISHAEEHVVEEIKKKHPEWAESGGVCKRCYEYYKDQLHRSGK